MTARNTKKFDPVTENNLNMWLEGSVDEELKKKLYNLMDSDPQQIIDAFYTRLSFGTGGMRGVMGPGTNRMNKYTIGMATQGLANYLKKHAATNKEHSVIIGYDSRHHSRFFAEEAAKVLAGNNTRVFLFKELSPTPLVSFGCRFKKCSSAIMITASHNPPEYNGYKVYWNDGGQVVPPHDQGIIDEVKAISELSMVKSVESVKHPLIEIVGRDIEDAYLETVKKYQNYPQENSKHGSKVKIVYTSLHGTGTILLPKTVREWGFKDIELVEEQCTPDGNFPTVKYPNPEELEALSLGIETMNKTQGDLLIATDPDADRVGVVVLHEGDLIPLNGNQIACICLYHICEALSTQSSMPEKAAFLKTIATTELFKAIAENYGGHCFNVLTGFKFIAEKITEWEKEKDGFKYIFGGEESYGYLLGTHCRDKDAVITSALICEAALHAKLQDKTLIDVLHEIYRKFGVYYEMLASIQFEETKAGRELMVKRMEAIQNNPPKTISGTTVISLEDYKNSWKTDLKTGKKTPLTLPKNDAYLFWLEDGTKVLIRPSGTEPKIKIYCGVVQKNVEEIEQTIQRCKERANQYLEGLKSLFTKL